MWSKYHRWLSKNHFPDGGGGGQASGDGGGGPQEAAWSPDSEEAPDQGRRNPSDPLHYILLAMYLKSKFNKKINSAAPVVDVVVT